MKKICLITVMLFITCYLPAQDREIIAIIRNLEQMEVQAVLKKDSVGLRKLWDNDLIVNSPANTVVLATGNPADRPVMRQARGSFTREVEQVLVKGDIVFSMGSETLVPLGDVPASGETVKRRYTNVWMKKDGEWKLVARHANLICK